MIYTYDISQDASMFFHGFMSVDTISICMSQGLLLIAVVFFAQEGRELCDCEGAHPCEFASEKPQPISTVGGKGRKQDYHFNHQRGTSIAYLSSFWH